MNLISIESDKLSCHDCSLFKRCLPRGLSGTDLARFEEIVDMRSPIPKGGTLYRAGEGSYALYAIRSGAFKSVATSEDGEEQIVGFHLPGELFGFDDLNAKRSCTAVSLDHSIVCEIPFSDLEFLAQRTKALQQEIYTIMRREISTEQTMLSILARSSAEGRLASFIAGMSYRLRSSVTPNNEFNLFMSRNDIANHLGLAAETVSRLMTRFKDKGIIEVDHRQVRILDQAALVGVGRHSASTKT